MRCNQGWGLAVKSSLTLNQGVGSRTGTCGRVLWVHVRSASLYRLREDLGRQSGGSARDPTGVARAQDAVGPSACACLLPGVCCWGRPVGQFLHQPRPGHQAPHERQQLAGTWVDGGASTGTQPAVLREGAGMTHGSLSLQAEEVRVKHLRARGDRRSGLQST